MGPIKKLVWEARRRWHNWRWVKLGNPNGINLYVDDSRVCTRKGWYHAATAEEALDILRSNIVNDASFDHDLGDGLNGYNLVMYLAERSEDPDYPTNYWPKNKPNVHSANPAGAANMQSVIDRYGPYPKTKHRHLRSVP